MQLLKPKLKINFCVFLNKYRKVFFCETLGRLLQIIKTKNLALHAEKSQNISYRIKQKRRNELFYTKPQIKTLNWKKELGRAQPQENKTKYLREQISMHTLFISWFYLFTKIELSADMFITNYKARILSNNMHFQDSINVEYRSFTVFAARQKRTHNNVTDIFIN